MEHDYPYFCWKLHGMNWKCKILGHTEDENHTDSGYFVCQRCSAHSYYEGEAWNNTFRVFILARYWCLKEWIKVKFKKPDSELPF